VCRAAFGKEGWEGKVKRRKSYWGGERKLGRGGGTISCGQFKHRERLDITNRENS